MSAAPHADTANRVMSALRGCQAAQRTLQLLREGLAHPDALHEALQAELAHGDADRTRGFVREVQKAIERAGVAA